jgi:hypothetical protein
VTELRWLRDERQRAHDKACACDWAVPVEAPIPYWPETPSWHELAWQARFDEVLFAPESDIEDAFLSMVTGWCRDEGGAE